GPDTGLLAPAWETVGGVRRAVEITSPAVVQQPVAESFHARDVFAPAAAQLAKGMPLEQLGSEVDTETLAGLTVPEPQIEPGKIRSEVVDFNRFGNVKLNAREEHLVAAGLDLDRELAVEAVKAATHTRRAATYPHF